MEDKLSKISNNLNILKVLANPNTKYSKLILANADKKLIDTLSEIIYNVLKNNINISENDKNELIKYKKSLIGLVKKGPIKKKRKILIQKGGFLQFILPAIITGVSSIISAAISNE